MYVGEPDHGKGTIDAMSSFGCKTPMRKEIVSKDAWFGDAETMVEFLNEDFENDDTKNHFLVDAEKMSEIRKKERGTLNIKGSRKMHLITVNPAGTFFTIEHYKNEDFITHLSFFEKKSENNNDEDREQASNIDNDANHDEDEDGGEEQLISNQNNYLYEVIEPGYLYSQVSLLCKIIWRGSLYISVLMGRKSMKSNKNVTKIGNVTDHSLISQ